MRLRAGECGRCEGSQIEKGEAMIQIKRRDGSVIHTDESAETLRDAVIRYVVNHREAGTVANLRYANLSAANLSAANLRDANLSAADLRDAINGPIFTEMSEAGYLKIRDEFRARHPEIPIVPQLDKTVCELVDKGEGALDMSDWHSCETTHCRAGWAIHLAGKAGYELEAKRGSEMAGGLIYRASTGRWPNFFASNEAALADICEWGAKESD